MKKLKSEIILPANTVIWTKRENGENTLISGYET
jgi:hypothetical protein